MKLPTFGVKRPVSAAMLFIGLFLIGIVSFTKLSIDLMPKIESPTLSILTFWQGNSAEDVETKVTKIIENNLSIVNNLEEIRSTTKEGLSMVHCTFEQGIDLNEASNDIRDRLEFAKAYMPNDITDPVLCKYNTSTMPIMFYGITAKENLEGLHDIAEDQLATPIKRIPGVGGVYVLGGAQRQIHITLDREKLFAYGIGINEVEKALTSQNLSLSAGTIEGEYREQIIRVPGEYKTLSDIKNVIVKRAGSNLVHLKDIATIEQGVKEAKRIVRINQKPGIILMIQKRAGANTVKVSDLVKDKMEMLKKDLPLDVDPYLVMDFSTFIRQAIHNLMKTALFGILFVSLITFLFFRNIRTSSIVIVTIPVSIIIPFSFLYLMDWSINIISLAALAIAIGMVVDNAIVIIDNIVSHISKGKEGVIDGASEVGMAVSASTFTSIVVFLPLLFISGIVGIMFKQLGGVLAIALLSSLFCALLLIPMLASKFLSSQALHEKKEGFFTKVEHLYSHILSSLLSRRKRVIITATSLFCLSLLLIPIIGTELMPEEDSGDIQITLQLPVGTPLKKTAEICEQVEVLGQNLIGHNNFRHSYFRCGSHESGMGAAFSGKEDAHIGYVGFKLIEQQKRKTSSKKFVAKIAEKLKTIEEIEKFSLNAGDPMSNEGMKPISIEVFGHDFKMTEKIARQIQDLAKEIKGTSDITISRDMGKPELLIQIDKEKAATLGLDAASIATTIRTLYLGKKATTFHQGKHEYDIFLRLDPSQRRRVEDVLRAEMTTPEGKKIPLSTLASLQEAAGPVDIERKNQERVLTVDLNVYGRSQGEVTKDIQKKIAELISLPPDTFISYGGEIKEKQKAFSQLLMMLILGVVLVYMVMAAQFESFKSPFIVMFAIPFAFSGVLFSLLITGATLNAMSFIGIVMLTGIVVNNAIVLIDSINTCRKQGLAAKEAVQSAARKRLRPVLITTLTTIFGMMPLIFSRGEGTEIWKPLGIAVTGGLIGSTLITLLFLPVLYLSFQRKKAL